MEEYFQTFFQVIMAWKNVWKHSFMGNDWYLYQVKQDKQDKQIVKNISSHLRLGS